jgi:hypothetical protein
MNWRDKTARYVLIAVTGLCIFVVPRMGKPFQGAIISDVIPKASMFVGPERVSVSDVTVKDRKLSDCSPALGFQYLVGWLTHLSDQNLFGSFLNNGCSGPVRILGDRIHDIEARLLFGYPSRRLTIVPASDAGPKSCAFCSDLSDTHFSMRTIKYRSDARNLLYVNNYPRAITTYESIGLPFDVTKSSDGNPRSDATDKNESPSRKIAPKGFFRAIFRLGGGFCTFFFGAILVYNRGYGSTGLNRLGDILFFIGWFLLLAPIR